MRVLVLAVDGLRPDFLGAYGCEWVETPTLDGWAASGVVYDEHYAESSDPGAFERAIRTGRHPLRPADVGADVFADLEAAGVHIVRIRAEDRDSGEPLALKPTRRAVRQAIEQLADASQALIWIAIDALLPPWQPSEDAIADFFGDEATDEDDDNDPAARPIDPWTGPLPDRIAADDEETLTRLQHTYAATVASLDAGLERLLRDCSKRGWGEEALWVLTSGRGFPLGEHGAVGFAAGHLHEELIHLPLLLRWPNAEHAGLRVSAFTQPADLAPTLREVFGIDTPEQRDAWTGQSLSAVVRRDDNVPRPTVFIGQNQGDQVAWGVRSREWFLLLDDGSIGSRRLYVKPDDRWEVNDVFQRNLELAEEMERNMSRNVSPGP